jgi:hypothetical protein
LSEIIWRNHVHNENIYEFFSKSIFRLDCDPRYAYSTPLFRSCTPPSKEDEASHKVTIVQESDSEEKVSDEVAGSSLDPSAPVPSQGTLLPDSRTEGLLRRFRLTLRFWLPHFFALLVFKVWKPVEKINALCCFHCLRHCLDAHYFFGRP